MLRVVLALLVASLALSSSLASGASAGSATSVVSLTPGAGEKIVLRGRQGIQGPWRRYLWLELDRNAVISFSVCAVWHGSPTPSCRPPLGKQLPAGSIMKLEQRRGRGWRTVATSAEPALQAVLSNDVTGNRLGTTSYRVTLRNESRRIIETSNTFKVFWHR